jgi:hypothetical protein
MKTVKKLKYNSASSFPLCLAAARTALYTERDKKEMKIKIIVALSLSVALFFAPGLFTRKLLHTAGVSHMAVNCRLIISLRRQHRQKWHCLVARCLTLTLFFFRHTHTSDVTDLCTYLLEGSSRKRRKKLPLLLFSFSTMKRKKSRSIVLQLIMIVNLNLCVTSAIVFTFYFSLSFCVFSFSVF